MKFDKIMMRNWYLRNTRGFYTKISMNQCKNMVFFMEFKLYLELGLWAEATKLCGY